MSEEDEGEAAGAAAAGAAGVLAVLLLEALPAEEELSLEPEEGFFTLP